LFNKYDYDIDAIPPLKIKSLFDKNKLSPPNLSRKTHSQSHGNDTLEPEQSYHDDDEDQNPNENEYEEENTEFWNRAPSTEGKHGRRGGGLGKEKQREGKKVVRILRKNKTGGLDFTQEAQTYNASPINFTEPGLGNEASSPRSIREIKKVFSVPKKKKRIRNYSIVKLLLI
jgi:hypothetical protein